MALAPLKKENAPDCALTSTEALVWVAHLLSVEADACFYARLRSEAQEARGMDCIEIRRGVMDAFESRVEVARADDVWRSAMAKWEGGAL